MRSLDSKGLNGYWHWRIDLQKRASRIKSYTHYRAKYGWRLYGFMFSSCKYISVLWSPGLPSKLPLLLNQMGFLMNLQWMWWFVEFCTELKLLRQAIMDHLRWRALTIKLWWQYLIKERYITLTLLKGLLMLQSIGHDSEESMNVSSDWMSKMWRKLVLN